MKHAIVVDDEKSILMLITAMLETTGWEVTSTVSGREALRLIGERSPDILITDISMPDMEGIELLREARHLNRKLPIIVMSGNPVGYRFLDSAKIIGARASLAKPFSKGELELTIRQVLEDDDAD